MIIAVFIKLFGYPLIHNTILRELLATEVPEIGEGQLEIVNVVRDPGFRAKVSIRAKDRRIDPKGACIGMKGSRIKNVSNELCQENIDIIIYDDDISKYVINAMEPAEVKQAIIDKDKKLVQIGVDNDERKYAKAIGSNGQNVRLAAKLTGFSIDIRRESDESDEAVRDLTEGFQVAEEGEE